jgi:predicted homoserine dehydrogenase-like protein
VATTAKHSFTPGKETDGIGGHTIYDFNEEDTDVAVGNDCVAVSLVKSD